jgi:hypothetical protein
MSRETRAQRRKAKRAEIRAQPASDMAEIRAQPDHSRDFEGSDGGPLPSDDVGEVVDVVVTKRKEDLNR